ncbi:hypothetical protein GCM10008927_20670 [Amylibacter ulvae]|uniref:Uncharacterized protein n=1 Tax=Paramylibacter ulvae TaxID=1651968 RepID=A0ABQ3D8B8_9RHOB|nr:DUF6165 family protein [Amylibacter ulvae]GHA54735.1 hypothetical protein GCM10008927_20670 [Amylibacter ulvae]
MTEIMTPIAPGELLDKLTILEIKSENISDSAKLANVEIERAALQSVADQHIPDTAQINALQQALLDVNKQLWVIEDDIRDCERAKDFGDTFVKLARAVYVTNDKRADLKKQINLALGSALVEEKSYAQY